MFSKFRKATNNFVMSVCESVRPTTWNSSTHTGWIFKKFDLRGFFEIMSRKLKA